MSIYNNIMSIHTIKLATINVNGLRNLNSLNYLKDFIVENKLDVVALQEVGPLLGSFSLAGYAIVDNSTKNNLGTAIIYNTACKIENIYIHKSNRIIKIKIENKHIINIYGYPQGTNHPRNKRDALFLKDLARLTKRQEDTIIVGDFNATTNKEERGWYSEALKNVLTTFEMSELQPQESQPTFISHLGTTRFDRVYSSNKHLWTSKTVVEEYLHSDHRAVIAQIGTRKAPTSRRNKSAFWKMNASVLKDEEYKNHLEELINKETDKIQDTNIQEWWETIFKPGVKQMTIKYCTQKRRDRKATEDFWNKTMSNLAIGAQNNEEIKSQYLKIKDARLQPKEELDGLRVRGRFPHSIRDEKIGAAHIGNEIRKAENNSIGPLEEREGVMHTTQQQKEDYLYKVYKKLYTLEEKSSEEYQPFLEKINTNISEQENKKMTGIITDTELRLVIENLKTDKTPGIEGLTAEFYQEFYPKLKEILLKLFNKILETKSITDTQRTGVITLIYKGGKRSDVKNWRPISLTCVDYKIISKIIANRIKPIISKIINPHQTGAMANRDIVENLTNIRNVLADANPLAPGCILNLDFEKAYDRVDRARVYQVMENFGFSPTVVSWIKALYEKSQSIITVNGHLGKRVDMERGVKQGCPLASALYVLYIEPLHLKIQNEIDGTRTGSSIIKTGGFVDDVAIYLSNDYDIYQVNKILNNFDKATNSKLNRNKTTLLAYGKWKHRKNWPLDWLKPQQQAKILGITFDNDTYKTMKINEKNMKNSRARYKQLITGYRHYIKR